jgi:Glycosyl hydrolase family 76
MRIRRRMAALVLLAALFATPAAAPAARPAPAQHRYLKLAEDGLAQARTAFWNARLGWYNDRLDTSWSPKPLAYLWTAFPLFETINAVAIAQPTPAHRAAVRALAVVAERYWNPTVGGYAYYVGTDTPAVHTYFDDNGWWGIAFIDAYRATGDRRYLADAARAFRFIVGAGWDPASGGIWWDTHHGHKTAEPLAAAAYVGAVLYRATRQASYLTQVRKLVTWADRRSWNARLRLYGRSDTDGTVMDYVQGMMIGARLELCAATGARTECAKAEQLARASLEAFPAEANWSPTADTIYLRFLLDLYRRDHDARWYAVAKRNAERARVNAASGGGLYLRLWDGKDVPEKYLREHAGTISLFAWLATVPPPR